ncbi:hypothetical protein EIN43_09900 [Enterobacter hormaechei]|uniref:Uncharacterized protein n=1 Tax=Enterobacter hormaechei TaxID=158836 RepID=A0A4Y5ZSV1_9ENTR|nr:hypothetical protein EIN43_09900 [Enterobacter hormaechei]
MPWILLLLFSLFSAPSLAVTLPGVTTGATASQQNAPPEPDAEKPLTARLPTCLRTTRHGRS